MVQFFGIPNIGYIGGAVGLIFLFVLMWFLLKGKSGRLGEELQEEKETNQLKRDEIIVEATQIDEKKECKAIKRIFKEIVVLAKNIDKDFEIRDVHTSSFSVKIYQLQDNINLALDSLMGEKMSVEVALENFKLLHASINAFLTAVPKGYAEIDRRIALINEHKNKYYKDLVKELNMNRIKKARLQRLWKDVINEESAKSVPKAA